MRIDQMNIAQLEAYIEERREEIRTAKCSRCRENRLSGQISAAEQRIIRLRRENKLAAAKAAAAEIPNE